jgi:C_GCAxxG_C_C family probable redox protein
LTHKDKAKEFLNKDYHCAQALVGAFADEFGFNTQNILKLSTCFGAGMRHGGLCGCVASAVMVCGMAYGISNPNDKELEVVGDKMAEEFYRRFYERMDGKVSCRDILGADISTPEGMAIIHRDGLKKKICPKVMETAIEVLDEVLEENQKNSPYVRLGANSVENPTVLMHKDNLHKFREDVNQLLLTSKKEIAFIQFDIKRFKIINDLYGELFGDEVLYFIREKLKELCGDDKFYVNARSDVFIVVMEYEEKDEIFNFIQKIEKEIHSIKNVRIQLTFGVYFVEDRALEVRQMEDRASMARKSAKTNVLTNVLVYQQQFKDILYTRKFIEENMQSALGEKQFKMYLQPKYSIDDNRIVGAEALVRWVHPDKGMIYPNEFIPVIEENGFIKSVDYYIWDEACHFVRKCEDLGIDDCPISVNVSRLHLKDTEFISVLSEDIKDNNIEKSLIELEITETVNEQLVSQMAGKLKEDDFTLLMDDFGSGYSSLNILLETPFDIIKLDKRFMDNMMTSEKGKTILEYVVAMSEKMGLGLIAEGVENKEQVDLLQKIGCDVVQGYYYAKPMPEEDFFEMLKQDRQSA